MIKAVDSHSKFIIRATHTDPMCAVSTIAHEFDLEPTDIDEAEYVEWCLKQCCEHSVRIFVPHRQRIAIAASKQVFESHGVLVAVMGDPDIMSIADQKHMLYADLQQTDIPVPSYKVFRTLIEFDAAVAVLEPIISLFCVKPCVGIYGAGFRILERQGGDLNRILNGDSIGLSFNAYRTALKESDQDRDMMIMEVLPGEERSVDVLAHRGRLIRAISRVKTGNYQMLETESESINMAAKLTTRYKLDGIFNLQTKAKEGIDYLLEINSRMSGGLVYACKSGIAFPYWNLMLLAGLASPEDIPIPALDIKVIPIQDCILI